MLCPHPGSASSWPGLGRARGSVLAPTAHGQKIGAGSWKPLSSAAASTKLRDTGPLTPSHGIKRFVLGRLFS